MTLYDAAGFLASSLVVIAFCMKDIVALRFVALASNVAFLIYGVGARSSARMAAARGPAANQRVALVAGALLRSSYTTRAIGIDQRGCQSGLA